MNKIKLLLSIFAILLLFIGCKRDHTLNKTELTKLSDENEEIIRVKETKQATKHPKISHVTFYLENSESMFGYVNGFTEYVDVVSELAEKPKFAEEKTPRDFYFINGGDSLSITAIGNNPNDLKDKLNNKGFRCGDVTKSNLNSMFQIALKNAKLNSISILISDGIYDLGKSEVPLNALSIKGKETRTKFIERLGEGDLQTIMIKLHSKFEGNYFPVSGGKIRINQTRPYYIWIFGDSELLNNYFPDDYIQSLKGYSDMARFLKFDSLNIPYKVTSQNRLGQFRFDRQKKNKLINAETDRNGRGFQFSFATDLSLLPFSDSYFQTLENYTSNGDYNVTSVIKVEKKIFEVTGFEPTHLITVSNNKSPYCELKITLKNVVPGWILKTNIEDESNIKKNTTQTFGFKFLTNAISEAYSFKIKDKSITNFIFEITK